MTPNDLHGALLIITAFGTLLLIAELWSRLGRPNPEYTRWRREPPLVMLSRADGEASRRRRPKPQAPAVAF
jgi:hypothetical protein